MKCNFCCMLVSMPNMLCLAIMFFVVPFEVNAADIFQGKCVQIDVKKEVILVEEYDTNFNFRHPYGMETGTQVEFDISTAVIGIPPENGDILRILYVIEDKTYKGVRLMNVSKQKELNR